ncbi:hypothetical protein [Marinicellulosiphila megalodicopiae]|uniref:hypothetical protein n=1 Tax=Marinicellulosiphila megalodicopiae TaxID=2724896 RepID=UPI003BB16C61
MMLPDLKLRQTPISTSPSASFTWFLETFKLIKGNLLQFYLVTLITPILMFLCSVFVPFLGIILSSIIYTFYCAAMFNACLKKQKTQSLTFSDFLTFNPQTIKPLMVISTLFLSLNILFSIPFQSSISEFVKIIAMENKVIEDFSYETLSLYFNEIQTKYPEITSKLISSFAIFVIGLCIIEAMMFFTPGIISIHKNINIMDAIKLNFIGLLKNSISFITYGLILSVILLCLFFILNFFGVFLFFMLLKVSSFAAYQEIFVEIKTNKDHQAPYNNTDLDSRDF